MKPVDDVVFHKIKSMRDENNCKSYNLEIEILDEGALDKALKVPETL